MKKDIYVELTKIINKTSFKVFIFLIVLITILLTVFNNKNEEGEIPFIDKQSKEEYDFKDYDKYLKKYDDYNKLYSYEILKKEYLLNNEVKIDNEVRSDLSVCNIVLLILSIYIIILGCNSFGYEYDKETIKLLMLYKSDRRKVVLSKFVSLIIISLFLSNLVYIINIITTIIINCNIFNIVELCVKNGNVIEKSTIIVHTCEYYALLIPQILLIALSLMMGLLFKGSALSSSISIFLLLCSSLITELFVNMKFKIIEYTFLPYMDYSIFIDKMSLTIYNIEKDININANTGLIIILVYSLIMLTMTTYIYKNRELR